MHFLGYKHNLLMVLNNKKVKFILKEVVLKTEVSRYACMYLILKKLIKQRMFHKNYNILMHSSYVISLMI